MTLKSVKKRAEFNKMKYIYKILSEQQIVSNFFILRILTVICAITETVLFAIFKNSYVSFASVIVLCLTLLVFVEVSKIKKSRMCVYLGYLTVLMIFEYILITGLFNARITIIKTYIVVALGVWIISHLFRIPFICSILSASEKTAQKKAERFGFLTSKVSLIFLIPVVSILRVKRHEGFFAVNWEQVFFVLHFAFSMFYVWLINRILFAIIYRKEILNEIHKIGEGSV